MHRWLLGMSLTVPVLAMAHGGGVDASGCHTKRATGEYHCHGGGRSLQAPVPPPRNSFAAPPPGGQTCFTGPRGGTYTITPSGRKNYNGC